MCHQRATPVSIRQAQRAKETLPGRHNDIPGLGQYCNKHLCCLSLVAGTEDCISDWHRRGNREDHLYHLANPRGRPAASTGPVSAMAVLSVAMVPTATAAADRE